MLRTLHRRDTPHEAPAAHARQRSERHFRLPQKQGALDAAPRAVPSSNWFIAELTHGLLSLQAASTGCPRDADLHM